MKCNKCKHFKADKPSFMACDVKQGIINNPDVDLFYCPKWEKKELVDWNKPIEVKVWGHPLKHANHDWTDARYEDGKVYVNAGVNPLSPWEKVKADGRIGKLGMVRNKKEPVLKRTDVKFEGKIEKLPSAKTVAYQLDCAYREDGILHAQLSYKHNKHDMVIYYEDLGDKVKILDWEGIKSWNEIDDMGLIEKYMHANERVYGKLVIDNMIYHMLSVRYNTLSTLNTQDIDINKNDIRTWDEFKKILQLIKKAAENLHRIRQEQKQAKKMKAVI